VIRPVSPRFAMIFASAGSAEKACARSAGVDVRAGSLGPLERRAGSHPPMVSYYRFWYCGTLVLWKK
jgi:hypothetical protein